VTTDAQALALAERVLVGEPRSVLHLVLMIAKSETDFGDGWGTDPARGAGSNNWGAVQGSPGFQHLDHHEDGTPYTTSFKSYATPADGLKGVAFEVLRRPGAREAAEEGDGSEAIAAMRRAGYFELPLAQYQAKAEKKYRAFLAATGEPPLLRFSDPGQGVPPGSTGSESSANHMGAAVDALVIIGLGFAAAWVHDLLTPPKGPKL
jgi:hypothetical protein